jgi:hypothetical protein
MDSGTALISLDRLSKGPPAPLTGPSCLIQYVDNLLLCSPTQQLCTQRIIVLLNAPAAWGYRVSKAKSQLVTTSVTHLGLCISPGRCSIPPDRLALLLNTLLPSNKWELLFILGLLNYFRIWIPNFSLIVKPLYNAAKGALGNLS